MGFPRLLIRRMIYLGYDWAIHKIAEILPRSFIGTEAFKRTWDSNASGNGERERERDNLVCLIFVPAYSFESVFSFLPSSPSFILCLSLLLYRGYENTSHVSLLQKL